METGNGAVTHADGNQGYDCWALQGPTTTTTTPVGYLGCFIENSGDYHRQNSPTWCSSQEECQCPAEYLYVGYTNGNGAQAEWSCFHEIPPTPATGCQRIGDWYVGARNWKISIYDNIVQQATTTTQATPTGCGEGYEVAKGYINGPKKGNLNNYDLIDGGQAENACKGVAGCWDNDAKIYQEKMCGFVKTEYGGPGIGASYPECVWPVCEQLCNENPECQSYLYWSAHRSCDLSSQSVGNKFPSYNDGLLPPSEGLFCVKKKA
jgi:hypothetical protein